MAVLVKGDILKALQEKRLAFSPMIDGSQLQPHAVDLRLGQSFYIPRPWHMTERGREAINVDPLENLDDVEAFDIIEIKPGQYFEILPQEFVICSTMEKIAINDLSLMAVLYPRSSINRRGLSVNLSGIIDTGYSGKLMIPIQNNTTNQIIKMYPGERVCQIVFEELTGELSKATAMQHGLSSAKYDQASDSSLKSKQDKKEETHLIHSGDLDALKSQFPISL